VGSNPWLVHVPSVGIIQSVWVLVRKMHDVYSKSDVHLLGSRWPLMRFVARDIGGHLVPGNEVAVQRLNVHNAISMRRRIIDTLMHSDKQQADQARATVCLWDEAPHSTFQIALQLAAGK